MFFKLKPHLPPFLLALAVLGLFWPALLHPFDILYPTFSPFSDVMVIHWPKVQLIAQSWQAGQGLPQWTPLILSGMPLAANQLAMLFYPPAWLLLFLPNEPVFNFLFIFHCWLGGFGLYLLLQRAHGLSPAAALLGGLTFALNGKWLAHAAGGHVSMVGAIAWMPWVLFGVQMLLQRGSEEAKKRRGEEAKEQPFDELRSRSKGAALQHAYQMGSQEPEQGRNLFHFLYPSLPSLGWAVLVAVALAMQIVTHTLPVIYSVYLIAATVVWHLIANGGWKIEDGSWKMEDDETQHATRFTFHASRFTHHVSRSLRSSAPLLIPLLTIPILAGLLGAAQLLPLLELAGYSNRSLSLSEAADFALAPIQLFVGLFLPTAQGGHEFVIYLGLIPLLLAPFSLSRRNRWTWFYGGLFIFTLLFALGPGNPLHTLFYHFAPGFRWVRTPARIFFVGALAIAVLVGFGVERLAEAHWSPAAKRGLLRLTILLGSMALLLGLGLAFGFTQPDQPQLRRAALALAIFMPVGLVLILLRAQRFLTPSIALTLLGMFLFLDLAWFGTALMRFVSLDEALAPGRPAATYLEQHSPSEVLAGSDELALFRVYSPSYSLPIQTAAAHGLMLADGVEPVHLAVYDQFMARAGGYDDPSFSVTIPNFGGGPLETALKEVKPNLKLLGLLNVKYLVAAFPVAWPGLTLETEIDGTFIYRNEYALPRAWVAHRTVPSEADWLAQLEALPELAQIATIESAGRTEASAVLTGSLAQEQGSTIEAARITHYSADFIVLETEVSEPGWLVLSEIWYPGWQATVNGSAQPVEKVNGLLRGLYLSQPGSYHITMTYQPVSVIAGSWLSGGTVCFLLLAVIFAQGRFKR